MTRNTFFALLAFAFSLSLTPAGAQKYFSRDGNVRFDATAPSSPEKIEAVNKSGTLVLDKTSGNLEMAVLLQGFLFEKALMQEHFNENYVESSKYPKATFKGKLDNPAQVDFTKDGTYKTTVSGNMILHGVSKTFSAPAVFTVKSGKISANATFSLALADYGISVPSMVSDKVAKQANITINADMNKM